MGFGEIVGFLTCHLFDISHIYFVAVKNLSKSLLYSKKVDIIALKLRSHVFIKC